MTPEQLAEIEARLKAASLGPWKMMDIPSKSGIVDAKERMVLGNTTKNDKINYWWPVEKDEVFIANAPSDIAALLEYVKFLESSLDFALAVANRSFR